MRTVDFVYHRRHTPFWIQHRPHRVHRHKITVASNNWAQNIKLALVKHSLVSDYFVWVGWMCHGNDCNTSKYLMGNGERICRFGFYSFIQFRCAFHFHSLTSTCLVIVDLFAENFTQWPRAAATTTWPNCIRRLYHCVRCNACSVRTVPVPESMLSAGLRDSIFIRRETTACTTNAGKVTYIFWFL